MKSKVYIIRDDINHPKEVIDPVMEKVFDEERWEVILTDRARDLIETEGAADLTLFFTNGRPEGEENLTPEEQLQIVQQVRSGMGMMFIHAGLVLIEPDSPFYMELNSGRFVEHSPHHVEVTNNPATSFKHPIIEGIEPFTVLDEHYYCQVDTTRTDVILFSTSQHVTAAGGWAHGVGTGKVVALTPGHNPEALGDPQMIQLMKNGANWAVRQS
ncbi:ThuA domain-containing protein [Paenibacillus gorillae]|uniref:ThuA domain-containing protein n=1 Tax=Paenibacillus gorillae TaxID=1243662 RepID=UPI0004BA3652|nr:ThuA domain-containing protein [Paenibacillus gorillae]